jgi:hypothetical protein
MYQKTGNACIELCTHTHYSTDTCTPKCTCTNTHTHTRICIFIRTWTHPGTRAFVYNYGIWGPQLSILSQQDNQSSEGGVRL